MSFELYRKRGSLRLKATYVCQNHGAFFSRPSYSRILEENSILEDRKHKAFVVRRFL